jgi:protocatechuate 3,4-dioxygenase beta subunit
MKKSLYLPRRREFILNGINMAAMAGGASLFATLAKTAATSSPLFANPGRFAELLSRDHFLTPPMVEGPFYPTKLPLDTDNDLLILNDSITPAVGEICHFGGRVMDQKGNLLRNARIEIWQCDANGVYMHPKGGDRKKLDTNFQGFGRFTTGIKGEYYFRTIKPVKYAGRTPHIHVAVYVNNKRVLTTQCLIRGDASNAKDGLFNRIKDPAAKQRVLADFKPVPNSKIGELSATFDLVVGVTPDEHQIKGKG